MWVMETTRSDGPEALRCAMWRTSWCWGRARKPSWWLSLASTAKTRSTRTWPSATRWGWCLCSPAWPLGECHVVTSVTSGVSFVHLLLPCAHVPPVNCSLQKKVLLLICSPHLLLCGDETACRYLTFQYLLRISVDSAVNSLYHTYFRKNWTC